MGGYKTYLFLVHECNNQHFQQTFMCLYLMCDKSMTKKKIKQNLQSTEQHITSVLIRQSWTVGSKTRTRRVVVLFQLLYFIW